MNKKMNGCFLDLSFIKNQLFSEGKLYSSTSLISSIALHIEIILLVNGMHEFIQKPDGDIYEVQVNNKDISEVKSMLWKITKTWT